MLTRIDAYDTELAVEEFGTGEPIVVFHSEEGPAATRAFAEELGRYGKVLMPHHPGFENRPLLPFGATIRDLAYAYHEYLQQQGLVGVPVVGSSLGAWIALELAALGGSTVAALYLLGPVGIKVGGREDRDFADVFAISDEERLARSYHFPEVGRIDAASLSVEALEAMARSREAFTRYAWEPYLHSVTLKHHVMRVRAPIHIFYGESDRLVRRGYYAELASLLEANTVREVAGAGHYPDVEQSTWTAAAIHDLMDEYGSDK